MTQKVLVEIEEVTDLLQLVKSVTDPDTPTDGVRISPHLQRVSEQLLLAILLNRLANTEDVEALFEIEELINSLGQRIRERISTLIIRENIREVRVLNNNGTLIIHF